MLDIRSIPGVSAAEARSLAARSLHSTDDLLRTNRAEQACKDLCDEADDDEWLCC